MNLRSSSMLFPASVFIVVMMLASVIAACGTSGVPPTSPTQAVITWPFSLNDGQWAIINGYRGNEDHAPGGSPNNYALFALDFAKCLPDKVITSQGSEALCDLSGGQADTVGAAVYSPVSGTVAWPDERCHGLSMDIDGHAGFRVVLFHIDPLPGTSWSQVASNHTHFNQGDKIGTVSAGTCIGSGNHIHMALYSCTDCPSDPASQRVGYPFTGSWSISNTPFPDDGSTSNEYLGLLVPLLHVAASTPTSTQIPAPVPTPTQPPTPTPPTLTVAPDHLEEGMSGQSAECSPKQGIGVLPFFQCTVTLAETASSQGNVDWSVSGDAYLMNAGLQISPASGTLSPGQSVQVTLYNLVCSTDPSKVGTITFLGSGGANPATVSWKCTLPGG